jgi:uncharacterized LabA/DUF88 family protein
MDRVAVFVDAGYLYAGGAKSLTGTDGTRRNDINLDIPTVLRYLISKAEGLSQQKLLRIYWYDAAPSSRPTTDHQILASTDNVKLRLGVINGFGQQKGVDGKIITDLTELSRNRAYADAVLLGGDEDLRIGVELAQEYGTRIHLLTIEGSSSSPTLRQESDTVTLILRTELQTFLSVRPAVSSTLNLPSNVPATTPPPTGIAPVPPVVPVAANTTLAAGVYTPPPSPVAPPQTATIANFEAKAEAEIKGYLATLSPAERTSLKTALLTGAGVPVEHDGRLLARARAALGRSLDQPEKGKLRRTLKKELGV